MTLATLQKETIARGMLGQLERSRRGISEYVLTFDVTVPGDMSDVNVNWHSQQITAKLQKFNYGVALAGSSPLIADNGNEGAYRIEQLERKLVEAQSLIQQYEEDIEAVIADRVENALEAMPVSSETTDWVQALFIAKEIGGFVAADGVAWVTCETACRQLGISRAGLSRVIHKKNTGSIGYRKIEGLGRTQYLISTASYVAPKGRR